MNQNLQNSYQVKDEISLKEIFNLLMESKKLIIITILIFISLSFLYASNSKPVFKSTASIEIGYFNMPDGAIELIEESSNLISELKVNLFYKSENKNLLDDLKITSLENRLIKVELESKSSETNKEVLEDFINYVVNKHNRLIELKQKVISNEIALLESRKSFLIATLDKDISNEIALLESRKSFLKTKFVEANKIKQNELEADLQYIENKIRMLNQIIIDESNNLALLASDKQLLMKRAAISPSLEELIFLYKSQILDLENNKIILVSKLKNLQGQLDQLENNIYPDDLFELDQKQKALGKKSYELELQTNSNSPTIQLDLLGKNMYTDEFFELDQKQKALGKKSYEMGLTTIESSAVGQLKTDNLQPPILLITLLGLIIGSAVGVFLVFIKKFINDFKES